MEMLDQIERLREKANVTYEEAKNALEAANGDLLDALDPSGETGRCSRLVVTATTAAPETGKVQGEPQRPESIQNHEERGLRCL